VFIESAGKPGSPFHYLLEDLAVLISVAVQSGVPVEALAKSLARVPAPLTAAEIDTPAMTRAPASLVGAIVDLLVEDTE